MISINPTQWRRAVLLAIAAGLAWAREWASNAAIVERASTLSPVDVRALRVHASESGKKPHEGGR